MVTLRQPVYSTGLNTPLLWRSLFGLLGLLLISLTIVTIYDFIVAQYTQGILRGSFFLLLTSLITGVALALTWRAYQNVQALQQVTALQQEGQRLMQANGYGTAMHYVNKITSFYQHRSDVQVRLERFYAILNDSHRDQDICALFSTQVMQDIDQQAYRIITQHAKETALLTAISQMALLDTILTLWRNISMIRDIATLYGGRPGMWGSVSLISQVIQNLIYADISEIVADTTAEIVGGSVLSMMSAQIAQGVGSGVMSARLGLQTMQVCRPLPFTAAEKPGLKTIRREIMRSIKSLFERSIAKDKKFK
jgi:putative membrane protein